MRTIELKFRAYNPNTKQMIYSFDAPNLVLFFTDIHMEPESIITQSSLIVDKNGIEIYIGDIVSIPYVDPMGSLHDEESYRSEIEYLNGEFVCRSHYEVAKIKSSISEWCKRKPCIYISNFGEYAEVLPESYLTVIGNIFQHPNLLKS